MNVESKYSVYYYVNMNIGILEKMNGTTLICAVCFDGKYYKLRRVRQNILFEVDCLDESYIIGNEWVNFNQFTDV